MAEENNNNNKEIIQAPAGAKLDPESIKQYEAQTRANTESNKKFAESQEDVAKSTKNATEKLSDFTLVQEMLGKRLTNVLFFTERLESSLKTLKRSAIAAKEGFIGFGNSLKKSGEFTKNYFDFFDRRFTKFGNNVGKKLPKSMRGATTATFRLAGAFSGLGIAIAATGVGAFLIIAGAFIAIASKFVKNFLAIDRAASDVAKSTGIFSQNISAVITGAGQFERLGGNLELVSGAFGALASNFSAAIKFTGELVGNTAVVAQEFGLGAENAAKLVEIISATQDLTLNQAAEAAENFVRDLGAIGPAIVKNLTEGYDEVVSNFGLAEKSLVKQAKLATELGLELSRTADISGRLLDFQTSIPAEFELSVRLGRQLNFNEARRLALQGKTAEATQEVVKQLGEGRDLTELNYFDAQAIQQATGLTVAELIRQQKVQEEIARGDRVSEKIRASALSNVERITNRIKGIFFKIFSSQEVTQAIEKLFEAIQTFMNSEEFQNTVQSIANYVSNIADYLADSKNLGELVGRFGQTITDVLVDIIVGVMMKIPGALLKAIGIGGDKKPTSSLGLKRGEISEFAKQPSYLKTRKISTDPSQTTREQSQQNEMLSSVRSNTDAVNNLAEKGITANTYLDGDKVSSGLARSNRYG